MTLNTLLQNVMRAGRAVVECLQRRGVSPRGGVGVTSTDERDALIERAVTAFRGLD